MSTPFDAPYKAAQREARASAKRAPWFVSKPLAWGKDPAGAMIPIVAPIRGKTFRYFRNAPRPETRELREAHKDFVRLNVNALPAT